MTVIQQIDAPSRIYQRPQNRFVSGFIGLSNFLDAEIGRTEKEAWLCFRNTNYRVSMENLSEEASNGMPALVAVRPEEFLIDRTTGKGIPACVRSSVFLGTTTHYFLTLPWGQEVEAISDKEEWSIIPDGTQVSLTVKPKRINVFDADGKRTLITREELL